VERGPRSLEAVIMRHQLEALEELADGKGFEDLLKGRA
jgi:hypothetical protein